MLNADDAEVYGDAEWQRDEDPTQPLMSNLPKKLSAHLIRIKQQRQRRLQQLAARGPGYTEQQRDTEVQARTPRQMWPYQRQAFRDSENYRGEKGVKKPITTFPQQITCRYGVPAAEMCLGNAIDGRESGGYDPSSRNEHPGLQELGLKTLRDSHPVKVSRGGACRQAFG
ncbi:MAG: hypothetical protein ACREEM_00155 [Blastocatellia bacterium]